MDEHASLRGATPPPPSQRSAPFTDLQTDATPTFQTLTAYCCTRERCQFFIIDHVYAEKLYEQLLEESQQKSGISKFYRRKTSWRWHLPLRQRRINHPHPYVYQT